MNIMSEKSIVETYFDVLNNFINKEKIVIYENNQQRIDLNLGAVQVFKDFAIRLFIMDTMTLTKAIDEANSFFDKILSESK